MVRSMTGFGRHEAVQGSQKITVEMKSVNHRYLDLNIKLPKKLGCFEGRIRTVLKEYVGRGKIDVYVTYEDSADASLALKYNEQLAGEYYKYLCQMSDTFGLKDDIRVSSLAKFPDIFTMEEQEADTEALADILEEALRGAAEKFVESRIKEGENLKQDLVQKLDQMLQLVEGIEKRSPQILSEYRKKLEEKVRELLGNYQADEGRILTEVALFADKICVDEETVRLKSHLEAVKQELSKDGAIGRKLDFIAQEMNREANTILSKANDLVISDSGIELKTSIEKVREQIQNIE